MAGQNSVLVSVIMPTYNSQDTIRMALKSIREQDFDQEKIEILVIDGGSSDSTLEIAKQFGAKILHNEKRLPEAAKSIGIQKAQGKYIVEHDSDEVYIQKDQLSKRIAFLRAHPEVKCMLSDRHVAPKGYAFSCAYLNTVGDPFTAFTYKSKGTVVRNLKGHVWYEHDGAYIFQFGSNDILPIGDGGTTMIDMDYVREQFKDSMSEQRFASTIFDDVVQSSGYVACIEDDNILHYSATTFRIYLKKLKFRVINNIFDVAGSGYAARAMENTKLDKRKFLYPFYCVTIILPVIDGVRLSLRFKDASLMMHPIYSFYVLFQILFQYARKFCGKKTSNASYGKS